MKQIKI